jgi:hypothetical protein
MLRQAILRQATLRQAILRQHPLLPARHSQGRVLLRGYLQR